MDTPGVVIGELQAEYVVSHDDDVQAIYRRFDRLVPIMAEECERQLGQIPDDVIVIDRLDVDVLLDAGADDMRAARQWGGAIANAIREAIGRPAAPGIAKFRDEAEYVAAFLDDVTRGIDRTTSRFPSLAPLTRASRSETTAAVLQHYGALAWRVLAYLHRKDQLERVIDSLTEIQLAGVARRLAPESPPTLWPVELADRVARIVAEHWPLLSRPLASPANWMRMVIWLTADSKKQDASTLCMAAEALRIADAIEQLGDRGRKPKVVVRLAEHLVQQGSTVANGDGETADPLARLAPGLMARAPHRVRVRLASSLARAAGSSSEHVTESGVPSLTSAGGFFLLIRDLLESDLHVRLAAIPPTEGIPGDRLGLYILGLTLAGPRAQEVRRDRGLALFAGLDAPPAPRILERAAAGIDTTVLLRGPAFTGGNAVVVPHDDGPVLVVHDASGEWRSATRVADRSDVDRLIAASEQHAGGPIARTPWAGEPVMQRDITYLFARHLAEIPEPVQATFAVLARRLMTHFARRLHGFESSSVPYLMTNFIAGPSTIEVNETFVHVTLPRTPLQMVLRLYGAGEVAAVPWLHNRRLSFAFP